MYNDIRTRPGFRWTGPIVSVLFQVVACGCENGAAPSTDQGGEGGVGPSELHGIELVSVTGRVLTVSGAPADGLRVTLCGPTCRAGNTREDGSFRIEAPGRIFPTQYSIQPHGSPFASTFYYPLPADLKAGPYDAGDLLVLPLPEDGPSLSTKSDLADPESPPAQSVTSGPVTLDIARGTLLRLAISDALAGEEGRRFRAVELDDRARAHFVPDLDAARVFALGPFEADFQQGQSGRPEVSVRVDNVDLPPGKQVEFLALGTYLAPDWLPPSRFGSIGLGEVSPDGASVELPALGEGPGLRYLTWLAIRPQKD